MPCVRRHRKLSGKVSPPAKTDRRYRRQILDQRAPRLRSTALSGFSASRARELIRGHQVLMTEPAAKQPVRRSLSTRQRRLLGSTFHSVGMYPLLLARRHSANRPEQLSQQSRALLGRRVQGSPVRLALLEPPAQSSMASGRVVEQQIQPQEAP